MFQPNAVGRPVAFYMHQSADPTERALSQTLIAVQWHRGIGGPARSTRPVDSATTCTSSASKIVNGQCRNEKAVEVVARKHRWNPIPHTFRCIVNAVGRSSPSDPQIWQPKSRTRHHDVSRFRTWHSADAANKQLSAKRRGILFIHHSSSRLPFRAARLQHGQDSQSWRAVS
jgi:hypothetical protein